MKWEKKRNLQRWHSLFSSIIFKKLYKPSRISLSSTNRRSNSARRKIIFYPTLIAQQASVLLSPSFKFFTTDTQDPLLLSNTQYTLPTITFIPISNITTSALLFSSLEIIPTPQSYPPLVLFCSLSSSLPPLFLILSPSDSRPIFRISQMGRENGGHVSKNERVGLFETWIIGWRTVLYIMSGAGRGLKTFSRSRNSRRTAASSLTSHSCKYFIDTRAIREKSARKSPLLFSIGERETTEGGVHLYQISCEIII